MLVLQLIFVTSLLLLFYIFKNLSKNLNHWKNKGVKYVKPIPLLGNMLPIVTRSTSVSEWIQHMYNAFPNERYVGIYQFLTPILLIKDPELIQDIAIKNFEHFVDHSGYVSTEVDPLWGKNLFASRGNRWGDLRQTVSPIFTSSKMRSMFVLMDECTDQLLAYFEDFNNDVIELELLDIFTRLTSDIIATTAFGIKCDSLKSKNNEFILAGRDITNVEGINKFKFLLSGNFPLLAKLLKIKFVSKRVGNFFKSVIDETISVRETQNIVRPDLIHALMLARKGKLKYEDYLNLPEAGFAAVKESDMGKKSKAQLFLTNEDITAQAILFFFAGFHTTSSLMAFTGYELAVNPQIQRKLKEEIINTSLECGGKITYESLLSMKYFDMVISESLRKWLPTAFQDRRCTKAFEIKPKKDGESLLKINVGDICWIPAFAIHRDPNYYPNPDVFDPERFNEANKAKIHSSTYLSFGIGPRNCIGSRFALLETKLLLFKVLLNYDFVPISKTQIPLKLCTKNPLVQPENGFHVGLKRNKNIN